MIFRIPQNISEVLIQIIYVIVGIIIFLWGSAVKGNTITEEYKRADKNSEVLKLREENKKLKIKNAELLEKLKLYLNTFSGIRNLIKKSEL